MPQTVLALFFVLTQRFFQLQPGLRKSCQICHESLAVLPVPVGKIMLSNESQEVANWLAHYKRDARTTSRFRWQEDICILHVVL